MAFLEKQFGIEVTQDDLDIENFRSLNSMTTFVATKQERQNG
jgi:acyl carrier protein